MRELLEFAAAMKQVTPEQRRTAMRGYLFWSIRSRLAQGWYLVGGLLLAVATLVAYRAFKGGEGDMLIYALCALGAAGGVWISVLGYRRERAWRKAHPFQAGGENA